MAEVCPSAFDQPVMRKCFAMSQGQSAHIMSAPLIMNREVVWFAGQPVAEYGPLRTPDAVTPLSIHRTSDTNTPANNLFYTFTDHLGTPLIQTDPSTTIVWRAEHEPYGNVYLMRKGSRADQPLRFPGQEAAMTWEGTAENYNVFRWYRAEWGRYTQADPMGLRGGSNLFTYSGGQPINWKDRLGLVHWKCSFSVFGGGVVIGGGAAKIACTSDCVNRRKREVHLNGSHTGITFGAPVGWSYSSSVDMEDNTATPSGANLAGRYIIHSVGGAFIVSFGHTEFQLGRAHGESSGWSWFGGFNLGLDNWVGDAEITYESESCRQ